MQTLPVTQHELSIVVRLLRAGALPAAAKGEPPLELYRSAIALHDRAEAMLIAWAEEAQAEQARGAAPGAGEAAERCPPAPPQIAIVPASVSEADAPPPPAP